jgi:hypothetical protein
MANHASTRTTLDIARSYAVSRTTIGRLKG